MSLPHTVGLVQLSHIMAQANGADVPTVVVGKRGRHRGKYAGPRVQYAHLITLRSALCDGTAHQAAELVVEHKLIEVLAGGLLGGNAEEAIERFVHELHHLMLIDNDHGISHLVENGRVVLAFLL